MKRTDVHKMPRTISAFGKARPSLTIRAPRAKEGRRDLQEHAELMSVRAECLHKTKTRK